MHPFVKQSALALASRLDIHPARLTDKRQVQSLLNKLRPVIGDKPLIRLGPDTDGGYLVPDDLSGIQACFSPGVDCVSGFEKDCADLGMEVFLADKSVEQPAESHERFHFTQKYLGVTTDDDFMTLDDWVACSLPASQDDLLLQMDIEGAEYEVLLGASDQVLSRFRLVVLEFHSLDQLWNAPFFQLASRALDKLLQTHRCVHIHPNNDRGSFTVKGIQIPLLMEFTFLRHDRITAATPATVFPHPLDHDNTHKPSQDLPACWHH